MESLQIYQSQFLEMLIIAPPFRWPKGALTASLQVLDNPGAYKPVYRSLGLARIAKREILRPSPKLPVDIFYQFRHRHMALVFVYLLSKLLALRLQGLLRGSDIQISKVLSSQVPVVPKSKSQKVQACSGLLEVNHLRLIPVNFQAQPGLKFRFDIAAQSAPLISRQHHKIISVAHNLGLSPVARTVSRVEHLLEPMKIYIRQKRRNDAPNAKDNLVLFRLLMVQMGFWIL